MAGKALAHRHLLQRHCCAPKQRRSRTPPADRHVLRSCGFNSSVSPPGIQREVLTAYHRSVAKSVGRDAGYAPSTWAMGCSATSGCPQEHEDDADGGITA